MSANLVSKKDGLRIMDGDKVLFGPVWSYNEVADWCQKSNLVHTYDPPATSVDGGTS